jgi:integrase
MKAKRKKETGFIRVGECLYRQTHNGMYYFKGQIRGREFTRSLDTTDRARAGRLAADFRREREHLDPASDRTTLAALCERYRESELTGIKPHTKEIKERILKRVEKRWPNGSDVRLNRIVPSDCKKWLKSYDNLSASTYNDHVWLLKDLFRMAVDDRLLITSPAAKLEVKRREDPERLTPTFEQFQAIIASVRSQKFNGHGAEDSADLLEAEGLFGLGQAELSTLTRGDVLWDSNQISVRRRKKTKRFKIPIYHQGRTLLEKLCRGKKHHEKLFEIQDAKKALAGACQRLDFPEFTQRSLRRMFVTRAMERGVDVRTIAEWQGHRDGGKLILNTYSHVRDVHSQRMARLMTTEEPENVVRMTKEGVA